MVLTKCKLGEQGSYQEGGLLGGPIIVVLGGFIIRHGHTSHFYKAFRIEIDQAQCVKCSGGCFLQTKPNGIVEQFCPSLARSTSSRNRVLVEKSVE
jgi:hypothetical protein